MKVKNHLKVFSIKITYLINWKKKEHTIDDVFDMFSEQDNFSVDLITGVVNLYIR